MRKNKAEKKKKICFAASSGGHFEQLMMLKPMMDKYDSFIMTEKTKYVIEVQGKRIYYLKQVNRKEKLFLLRMVINTLISFVIFIKERPDILICTGALAMIPICIIMKFSGKRLIYIESFAKVTTPTETGKLIYKFADQFYVQWESMLNIYPKAIFKGGIY
ncbi:MAG: PssD/Cps14F family polysaccharide biosynthesis glycosyltransferase [Anaerocolumna sp.]